VLHALGALLVTARLSHGIGIAKDPEDYRFRVFGMMGTFSVMGIAAVAVVFVYRKQSQAYFRKTMGQRSETLIEKLRFSRWFKDIPQ
jgi:hypothetical protein